MVTLLEINQFYLSSEDFGLGVMIVVKCLLSCPCFPRFSFQFPDRESVHRIEVVLVTETLGRDSRTRLSNSEGFSTFRVTSKIPVLVLGKTFLILRFRCLPKYPLQCLSTCLTISSYVSTLWVGSIG